MPRPAAARCRAGRAPARGGFKGGFTLIEMCMVLLIIVLLVGAFTPALQSAFVEQSMRDDTRELALMVRTAMLRCDEQHRPYVIDVTASTLSLHPLQPLESTNPDSGPTPEAANANPAPSQEDVTASHTLNRLDKIFLPNPEKTGGWLPVDTATWLFEPGNLCPVPRVRLTRDPAYIEISFNGLTGNVENEANYFP